MRFALRGCIVVVLAVLFSCADARAVTIAWTPVGNPGNAADPVAGSLYGAVGYSYEIDKYDVTNSQYVEFLNAKDPTGIDRLGLYNSYMGSADGGISYSAANAIGSKYSVSLGEGNRPVNFVTWYDAIRFANWLNNGQGNGDTESGAYTLLGGTPTPSNGNAITRNAGATVFLPSENEWFKAAYYSPSTHSYFQYATGSNVMPAASVPTGVFNSANYYNAVNKLTDVGAYTGTMSPYGAFDMNGNAFQWDETLLSGAFRGLRGGSGIANSDYLAATGRKADDAGDEGSFIGIRVASLASVPEPSSVALAALGLIGLAAWGWRRRRSRNTAVVLLAVLVAFAADAQAVTIAWSPVGNPGNAPDTASYQGYVGGFGAVGYSYSIATNDVTNSQYAEFLNAKDPNGVNTLGLYNSQMGQPLNLGGISFNSAGPAGSKYSAIPVATNYPVDFVTWYDAIRFSNWMSNGQGNGDTETGSYTLLGGTPTPSNANSIVRNPGATIVIPNNNEWYKAAYYNPATSTYFLYPTSSNTVPTAERAPGGNNSANYNEAPPQHLTDVGAYSGTTSPYGVYDMGGDVVQWTENLLNGSRRSLRGDAWNLDSTSLLAPFPMDAYIASINVQPTAVSDSVGFRLAMVPEPSSVILAAFGLAGLIAWGRRRKRAKPISARRMGSGSEGHAART